MHLYMSLLSLIGQLNASLEDEKLTDPKVLQV